MFLKQGVDTISILLLAQGKPMCFSQMLGSTVSSVEFSLLLGGVGRVWQCAFFLILAHLSQASMDCCRVEKKGCFVSSSYAQKCTGKFTVFALRLRKNLTIRLTRQLWQSLGIIHFPSILSSFPCQSSIGVFNFLGYQAITPCCGKPWMQLLQQRVHTHKEEHKKCVIQGPGDSLRMGLFPGLFTHKTCRVERQRREEQV